ncbi:MAG: T9SS type A sorting domain-containing protein, partial [Bacteroidota bacterium]|nr:T9SS type A sorting domain-containing protein [Bacteroidota bacterium]
FGKVIQEAQISIIDVYGKTVDKITIYNTDKYIISGNDKSAGVYFVEIYMHDKHEFHKLIVK